MHLFIFKIFALFLSTSLCCDYKRTGLNITLSDGCFTLKTLHQYGRIEVEKTCQPTCTKQGCVNATYDLLDYLQITEPTWLKIYSDGMNGGHNRTPGDNTTDKDKRDGSTAEISQSAEYTQEMSTKDLIATTLPSATHKGNSNKFSYFITATKKKFYDAKWECENLGGRLAIFSPKVYDSDRSKLVELAAAHGLGHGKYLWIGLNAKLQDQHQARTWIWADGSQFHQSDYIIHEYFGNQHTEYCGTIFASNGHGNGLIYKDNCKDFHTGLCQKVILN